MGFPTQIGQRFLALTKANLLILDDWGPEGLPTEQRRDLMEIVGDRYQSASILIICQLPLAQWHEIIGESTFADTILDHIVQNAHRIGLDGPSMRKTMAAQLSLQPSTRQKENDINRSPSGDDHAS